MPYNFIADSPELLNTYQSALDKNKRISRGAVIPGGKLVRDLFQDNSIINNKALDYLGGTGQYKLPQRLIAALAGGYALRDEGDNISPLGLASGYAAGAGVDSLIRRIREGELDNILSQVSDAGGLINIDKDYVLSQIGDIRRDIKSGSLSDALSKQAPLSFNLSTVPGSSYKTKTPSGYDDLKGYYSGDLLDEKALSDLSKEIPKQMRDVKNIPGYSRESHMAQLQDLMRSADMSRKELANIGIDAKSLRESGLDKIIKSHELAEMHTLGGLDKNINLPMQGGSYNRRGAVDIGTQGISANHASPIVPLREGNLQARLARGSAKDLNKKLQRALGEEAFFKKILGTELGDVVLSEKYLNTHSDDIAKILRSYITKGDAPEKVLLDKVRISPVTSNLGKAGRSIANLERGVSDALRFLLKRGKK